MLVQLGEQLPTIHVGQHDVQDNDLGLDLLGKLHDPLPGRHMDDLVPGTLGVTSVKVHQVRVIIHDKHRRLGGRGQEQTTNSLALANTDIYCTILRGEQFLHQVVIRRSIWCWACRDANRDASLVAFGSKLDLAAGHASQEVGNRLDEDLSQSGVADGGSQPRLNGPQPQDHALS